MRKENILVVVLVFMAIAGVIIYNNSKQARFSKTMSSDDSSTVDSNSLIDWKPFDQGVKLAKEHNKPVFLYFYADWCSYCKKLKKTTFKDKAVLTYLNEHFISIKVNTDIDRELASNWGVRVLPTSFFLDSDFTKINVQTGYFDSKRFISILKYHFTKSYKGMSYKQFIEIK